MTITKYICGFLLILSLGFIAQAQQSPVDYVNPYIGTSGHHVTEYGGTVPVVTRPFGMTQWTAMTRENKISKSAYHYDDKKIIGFIGSHQPAVWMGDYGYISIMPQVGEPQFSAANRSMIFSHEDEETHPHYYNVTMNNLNDTIKAEMTSSVRCGMFKFNFPEDKEASISIEASRTKNYNGYLKIIPEKRQIIGYNSDHHNEISGKKMGPDLKNFKGYFVIQFDTDFKSYGTYQRQDDNYDVVKYSKENQGDQVGGYVTFQACKQVMVKISTSFISIKQALDNLNKEAPDWDFKGLIETGKQKWNEQLSTIMVDNSNDDNKTIFYTAMYHSLLYPRIFSEYGCYYSAFDDKIHTGVAYNDYSLWDTFRALHPLLMFIAPEHVSPMMQSLVNMYKEGGWLPKWPNPTYSNIMIGSHADAILADAYVKGFRDFDAQTAYEAMYKNAMTPPDGDEDKTWRDRAPWSSYEGRAGLTWYKQLGYVPVDKTSESVSRTLEFAYDDFCVAQMAKALEKREDYELFLSRSKNYKNVFNPESGFMHPRRSDGTFTEKVSDRTNRPFTEGSYWTYFFCAMQDIDGLVRTIGGKDIFLQKLNENFEKGHYRHDNEPGHHYPYLYNYIGQNHKTQELIDEILKTKYQNSPVGLCGNDDCGQMSAWYILSAMGFYSVTPGSDVYALGKPLFKHIELKTNFPGKGEKVFTIKAPKLSAKNRYVKSVSIDGRKLEKPFLKHSDFVNAKVLEFEMDSIPHKVYVR
ncbi:glycoside hydrolase family 92 protein [Puteibacter caeruleilacunae]|nr:glycoside hydrolase family 92 protein [Puteibacter caeruleilacunae]